MFSLLMSLKSLFDRSTTSPRDRDEKYLAEAADIYDLERRMRQLDSGRRNVYAIGDCGIFAR